MIRPLRICLIAASRFPVREPFAGGLEAHTHALATALVQRGHTVSLFAGEGSDPLLPVTVLPVETFRSSDSARADVAAPPEQWMAEHHAYLGLMLELARTAHRRFDVIHNNTLHHLPVAMAAAVPVPVLTTLHTPPVAWLESAVRYAPADSRFAAVSQFAADAWGHAVSATTILNGVDTAAWQEGRGGGPAVWSGRMVPEKAPHQAIDACRSVGVPLLLAGPAFDRAYFEAEIQPRLGPDARYVGHLTQRRLSDLIGAASVAVVTPAWDEPYGLVAAEAMACGTPVAAFARGALPEIVPGDTGRLAPPGDVAALGQAVLDAADLDRHVVRRQAQRLFSHERMVAEYEALYAHMATSGDRLIA